jgi:hypothetical protein
MLLFSLEKKAYINVRTSSRCQQHQTAHQLYVCAWGLFLEGDLKI